MLLSSHWNEILFLFFHILLVVAIIRRIIRKKRMDVKEGLLVLLLCFAVAIFMFIARRVENVFANGLGIVFLLLAMVLYVYKFKKYPLRKAISISFMGYFFYFINDVAVLATLSYLAARLDVNPHLLLTRNLFSMVHILFLAIQTLLLITIIVELKKVKWLRKRIDDHHHIQKVLSNFNIILFLTLMFILFFFEDRRAELENPYHWLLLGGMIIVLYIGVVSYFAYISAKLMRMQQESQLKTLKYYVDEVEQQSAQIRQFKHDYQNIMLSLDGYIKDKEYEELESFFYKEVLKTAKAIDEKDTRLEDMKNIKSKEVKSILVAKMQKAFSLNIDIEFVAREEIEEIPLESITLIRIIGILLDNAIEAVQEIEGGRILVGILRRGQDTLLFVQNTCETEEVDINKIYQKGYSSKERGRGIGLANLSEFTRKHDNLFLKTEIKEGQFIQMVTIEGT